MRMQRSCTFVLAGCTLLLLLLLASLGRPAGQTERYARHTRVRIQDQTPDKTVQLDI
jgi:hypothetical protein